jgi:DNA-binding NtrC family response regulator/tetratricopeptide (TPR) repeat protein
MESSIRAFRRNLEPFEEERLALPWRMTGHIDPVSERRYLVSWTPIENVARADVGTFVFRCESAHAIAPDVCVPALEVVANGGRAEILTPYAAPLTSIPAEAFDATLRTLADALATLESNAFFAMRLAPELLGVDEQARLVILPGAYAIPPDAADVARVSDPVGSKRRGRAAHLAGFVATAGALSARAPAERAARVRALAMEVSAARIDSTAAAAAFLLDAAAPLPQAPKSTVPAAPPIDTAAVAAAIEGARVVVISGPAGSGRTAALAAILGHLRADGVDAHWFDEWDLPGPARRRGTTRDATSRPSVWLVDDAEERRLLHATLLEHIANLDKRPGTGLVVAVTTKAGAADTFMDAIQSRSPRGVHRIELEAGPARSFDDLQALDPQARQLLELVAVADAPLPFDMVLSIYPGADRVVHRHIHALAGAGLLAVETRRLPPSGTASIALRVPGATLRRHVREHMPESRRRNLHRSVARIAEERGVFPPMFVYEHLVRADEGDAAAATAAAFVAHSTRAQRAPFLDGLLRDVVEEGLYRHLSYGDQLVLLVRLGDDLLARGRQSEAETILTRARSLRATGDDTRANAALACEATRLLADAWAARGRIRQALELLEETREDVAAYLSLAEQARLLNDIGWLQYRLGDYSSCVDSCKFTVNTLNPNEHPLVVAQALNLLGVIAFNTSRYDEAISNYEQSAFLRQREDDQNALAGSYNNLSLAYQAKGEYDKALDHLHRSIDLKRRQNNEAGIAGGFLNLACLYLEVHNADEAERKCQESLRISSRLGLAQLVAENHNTLGDIVLSRDQLDEAEQHYLRALEHAHRLATVNEEMGAQKRLAKLYIRRGRHEDARAAIGEASRLAQQIGSRYEQAQTEEIWGDFRAAENLHDESVDHFEKATTLYATLSKNRMAAACLAKAGLGHSRSGKALDAKRYLDRAQDLIKSQIGHEIPQEIVALQQTLRENPLPSGASGTESQKLLYAFYELASLSEYAEDKGSFVRRIIHVFKDLAGATRCTLALRTDDERFAGVSATGEEEPVTDPTMQAVLTRALQLGTVLHGGSPEITDIIGAAPLTDPELRLVIVPMKSMGRDLGCVVLHVPAAAVPESKEEIAFISCIGRHVAGDLRLSIHLDERSHKERKLERELDELGAPAAEPHRFQSMIGRDESMRKVFRMIDKIKDMDTGILIFGESGTGKTELARTVHYNSPRRRHVFQSIHCAEIPHSLLESELFGHERGAFTGAVQRKMGRCEIADGGTVFLDDVNVMPFDTQSKLLHYLETKSFTRLGGTQKISTDVRIIAASNEDLERLVKEGRFREDLYYRLKVIQIELPPLRDRQEDLILIAQEFVKKRCHAQGKPLKRLSSETIKLFQKYKWPGNVRELQNVLEQIVLLCDDDIVEPASLPDDFLKRAAGGGRQRWESLEQLAQQMVESGAYSDSNPLMPQIETLLASKMSTHIDNKTKAAGLLGITKPTLYSRLRGYERFK